MQPGGCKGQQTHMPLMVTNERLREIITSSKALPLRHQNPELVGMAQEILAGRKRIKQLQKDLGIFDDLMGLE